MKIILILTFFSFVSKPLFSQDEPDGTTKTQFTFDAGLSGLQLGAELKTGKTHTVQFRTGLLPLIYREYDFNSGEDDINITNSLSVSAEYRFYYNFSRRIEKHKDVRNNGANYAGFLFLYAGKPFKAEVNLVPTSSFFMAGPTWGFNRPLAERILVHLSLGPVYEKRKINDKGNINLYCDLRWSFRVN